MENIKTTDIINPQIVEEYNSTIQQELFALPVNPEKVASLEGFDLYSSEYLRNKYINAMYNISKVKPIAGNLEKLVNRGTIIPCWINRGILRLAIFKRYATYAEKGMAGFYHPKSGRVYILMDNNINWGFASDKFLADLMLHELMHLASDRFKNSFISMFYKELLQYYNAMFEHIFSTKGDTFPDTKILIRFLFKNFEYKQHTEGDLKKYLTIVTKLLSGKSNYHQEVFNSTLSDFYHFLVLSLKDMNTLYNKVRQFNHIYSGLLKGYSKGLNVVNNQSFVSQELIYPSEVISMYAELYKGTPSKCLSVIKKL